MVADGPVTTVTYRAEIHLKGARKMAEPLLSPALGRLGDDAEQRLAEALERLPVPQER